MISRARRTGTLVVSFAVVLAPWPAWGRAARVVVPRPGFSAHTGFVAPAGGAILPLAGALTPTLAPSLSLLTAPSLQASGAPIPLIPMALAAPAPPAAPAASAIPAAPAAPAEFTPRPGVTLDESVWAHAAARGFELKAPAADGVLSAGAARLSAASDAPAERRDEPAAAKKPLRLLPSASSLWMVLGNVALIQLGVEAMSLAVPQHALAAYGYGTMAAVSAASSIALAVGSLLGSWSSDKLGPERTYVGTLVARVAVAATLAGLFAAGLLPAAALVALFAADFALHYMNTVSLDALAPRWHGGDAESLNRFGVRRQIAIDAAGLLGPLAAGAAIALWGFGSVFWVYPAIFAAAAVAGVIAIRRLSDGFSMSRRYLFKADGWGATLRTIWSTPALRWSVAGFTLASVVMMSLYFLAGPAFGAAAAAASGGSASQITGVMTGLFAGGGVLGALLQQRMTRGVKTPADLQKRMGWSLAAFGVAVLSFWALLATSPLAAFTVFGVAVPVYLAQLLMIPLGAAWAVPTIGLITILQTQAGDGAKAKVAGVNRFTAMFASFLFSLALGGLFSGVVGTSGFVALAGILTALAAASIAAGLALARSK